MLTIFLKKGERRQIIIFPKTRRRFATWIRKNFLEASSSTQITNANLKNFVIKFAGAVDADGTTYEQSEYDLSEIKDAVNTDSYLKIACIKYYQLIMKSGYQITSVNENAVTYIKQRIRAMEFGTGTPFDVLMNGIAQDLVTYSNAFLVKSRVDKIANGLEAKGVLDKKPVGGYFRMDPTTVTIKRSSDGQVQGYQQEAGSTTKTYKTSDVVHFYIDKDAGNAFGTPRISSALEDVKILRKVEGNTLSLLYRFALPLYQMKIGLPQENFMATDKEIREAQTQVEKMPMDGILITNERTAFEEIGAKSTAIDMTPYLQYYEKRVFSALNVSESMMGRGGAKQDADSMEQQIHDQVKFFQHMIEIFMCNGVFDELLLEGGYNPIFNEEDRVSFTFNEISLDTRIKLENHVMTQYQGNMLTFDEARRQIGLQSENVDQSQLYANLITQTNAKELLQMKLNATDISATDGRTTNGKTNDDTTPNKAASSVNAPSNQHGTYSAKVKESAALPLSESMDDNIRKYKQDYPQVYKRYAVLRNKIGDISKEEYLNSWESIRTSLKRYTAKRAADGVFMVYFTMNRDTKDAKSFPLSKIEIQIDQGINKIRDTIWKEIQKKKEITYRKTVMDTMSYRLRFLTEYITKKAYWYGYAVTAKKLGANKLSVHFHSEDDKKAHKQTIDVRNIKIDDIPPFTPYCKCTMSIEN